MDKSDLRLECLKIAASTRSGHHSAVVKAAEAYTEFVEKGGDDKPVAASLNKVGKRKSR
jgi:hypothetical protein